LRKHAGLALKKSDVEQFAGYPITFRVGMPLFDAAVQPRFAAGRLQSFFLAPKGFDDFFCGEDRRNTVSVHQLSNRNHIPATIVDHGQDNPFVHIPFGATKICHAFIYFGHLQPAEGISVEAGTIPAVSTLSSF
jgi:hypothetical protein